MINIVLLEPEIAQNTGAIGRSCLLTNSRLHLIRPFKFTLQEKQLRRTGLDYWQDVDLVIHDNFQEFIDYIGDSRIFYIETKTDKYYHNQKFEDGDYLMFGKESLGIDDEILEKNPERILKVPMISGLERSLNLANTVNIVLFEALRQLNFPNMD